MNDDYHLGYEMGFDTGVRWIMNKMGQSDDDLRMLMRSEGLGKFRKLAATQMTGLKKKAKRKVRQTPKQKLLTQMTKKKWDKYKKGRGKKTYVEIRAEVSRSLAFKKKARGL